MRENLDLLGTVLQRFLSFHLPRSGDGWWEGRVISSLTTNQRFIARERGWTSVQNLDLAALLRVTDGNWDLLRENANLNFSTRNLVKESQEIRNRIAHESPSARVDDKQQYRDLDTLARLAASLLPESPEARALVSARDGAFQKLEVSDSARQQSRKENPFFAGNKVRLRARPKIIGVVTGVQEGVSERTIAVFHDNAEHSYFESQLEAVEQQNEEACSPEKMRVIVSATLLLHPTTNHLYSFNSGRIDYEPYQFRPVLKLISADRPRLLIADDVGVGKTIEAGLVIKELQARQPLDSVLVICPKQLVVEHKWRNELKRFDEDFIELDSDSLRHCIDEYRLEGEWPARYRKAILPYSLLDERLLLGSGQGARKRHGLTSLFPPLKFDLVLVDEAHHVRNRETWKHRVVRHLLESADAAVLISATPIQTGSGDLFSLLQLLRPDLLSGVQEFERMREPNAHLALAEQAARRGGATWQAEVLSEFDLALNTAWGSRVMRADPRCRDLQALLEDPSPNDALRVRVVRTLQSLNTFSGLINRTRRRDIGAFTIRKPETVEVSFTPQQQLIYRDLMDICARIVQTSNPTMSLEFLLSTLKRQASSSINGLAPFIEDLLGNRLSDEDLSEADYDDESLNSGELSGFRGQIHDLGVRAQKIGRDPKLDALLSILEEKQSLSNNKLLVFSTFRHTLIYLESHVSANGIRVGLVHGDVPDSERRDIRARFALPKEHPEALDALLSSEVGTEGLDNQFCDALVNYDIPWNPMRIEQRVGRIDRRGQTSEAISIKNLVVRDTVDAKIYSRCLERIGVFRQSLGGSEEILGELTGEIRRIADDLSLTEEQRDQMLQQLADNKLARIQEQSELEEREASLFGLQIQRLDDEGVEAVANPWLNTRLLDSLVSTYLEEMGYPKAKELFNNSVGVFRPDERIRGLLLESFQSISNRGVTSSRWGRWLENPRETSRRLTFDPQLAQTDDFELLGATHPLVRAAASHFGVSETPRNVSLLSGTSSLPPGRYPFALYSWITFGVRDSFAIRILSLSSELEGQIEKSILFAGPGNSTLTVDEEQLLQSRHFDQWAKEREEHRLSMQTFVQSQIASIELSHAARVAQLEDQLRSATHGNIRRMRESELKSLEHHYLERLVALNGKSQQCDIATRLLFRGVLEVVQSDRDQFAGAI